MAENLFNNEKSDINKNLLNLRLANGETDADESIFPYVIFTAYTNTFALNCKYIQSIEAIPPKTTEMSQSSPEIRGVSYYKEQAINLIDLRRLLGIMTHEEYLTKVLDIPKRIQEHQNFVINLEDFIQNDKKITVNTNPHLCNLGKWIDTYKPTSSTVKAHIENITEPHELLHKSVTKIISNIAFGKKEEVHMLFDEIKNNYSKIVIEGLNELERLLQNERNELVLIIKVGTKTLGLIVDTTESVEPIDTIQMLPEVVIVSKYVQKYGLRNKDNSLLLILEASAFA